MKDNSIQPVDTATLTDLKINIGHLLVMTTLPKYEDSSCNSKLLTDVAKMDRQKNKITNVKP